jgi:hypothetical protein
MRAWLFLGAGAAVAIAAYAELVLDIRTPRSDLVVTGAVAAIVSFPTGEPDPAKKLAGMYGLFVVSPGATESTHPFSIVPGNVGSSTYRPTLASLRDRFGAGFPARPDASDDTHTKVNACTSASPSELGFGRRMTKWLRLRSQAACVVRWNGAHPVAMMINVTLAEADPWMRPFVRWICRRLTATALKALAARQDDGPDYAACVLVDRPGRIRPGEAQDTFRSVLYEVRNGALSRMD